SLIFIIHMKGEEINKNIETGIKITLAIIESNNKTNVITVNNTTQTINKGMHIINNIINATFIKGAKKHTIGEFLFNVVKRFFSFSFLVKFDDEDVGVFFDIFLFF